MKKIFLFIITISFILASCGSSENKTESSETVIKEKKDTVAVIPEPKNREQIIINADSVSTVTTEKISEKKEKTKTVSKAGQSRAATRGLSSAPEDLFPKIDNYLVSAAKHAASHSGGITNCIITVTNALPDITFQKAVLEVIVQKQDGTDLQRNYYTVLNLEPGISKVVKIPNNAQGSKVLTQIVKVKSTELTNGEWVLTGSHFVSN